MSLVQVLDFLKSNHEVANTVSALASAFVALLALLLSVFSVFFAWRSLRHQRVHNSLTFQPLPYIAVGDYEDPIYFKTCNNGTGPLILKR